MTITSEILKKMTLISFGKACHKDNFFCHKAREDCPYSRNPLYNKKRGRPAPSSSFLPQRYASRPDKQNTKTCRFFGVGPIHPAAVFHNFAIQMGVDHVGAPPYYI